MPPGAVRPDALLAEVPDPSAADLARVARALAERDDLWTLLAGRLDPNEPARVAGGRGWEAWLETRPEADGADVVRLEVRARRGSGRTGRRVRAVAHWHRTTGGLARVTDVHLEGKAS